MSNCKAVGIPPVRRAGVQVGSPARCSGAQPGGRCPSPALLLRLVIRGELSYQRVPQASLKLPRPHLSPYLGHLCRMIGTGLEKAAQDGPCGNPADGEGAAGSGMKYCDRTLQAPANHSC